MASNNGTTAPPEPANASAFVELGSTGLKRFGGYVNEEFLRVLQGRKAAETFREMRENDAIINAMLFAIEHLARQVGWRVDAASQDLEDLATRDFVNTCLDDMSTTWADFIAEILSFLAYGWHWGEIVYKRRLGEQNDPSQKSRYTDGLIGWRKIATRAQDSLLHWVFDDEGGTQAMVQQAPPRYQMVTIPMDKSLLFRPTTWKNNPEGRSLLRGAYRSWWLLKRMQEYEAIGLERDLAGYPVAQMLADQAGKPLGPDIWADTPAARAQKQGIETFIRSVRRDEQEGAVIPHWMEFKLLSTGSRRAYDTGGIIVRYEQRIAMTVLADFILVGHEGTGSFALSENKSRLFSLALMSFLDGIAEIFNRHAIPRLLALNGWQGRKLPKLAHGSVDIPDLAALGDFISKVAGAGMVLFPEPELEAALLSAAKLPTRDLGEVAKRDGPAAELAALSDPQWAGSGVRKQGGWRYDPDRRLFVSAVAELRDAVKGLGGNGHARTT